MESVESVESGERGGVGDGWPDVAALIELARRPMALEWTSERRDQIIRQMLERVERNKVRRRVKRTVATGVAAVLLGGLLLGLVGVGGDWLRPSFEVASKAVSQRLFAAAE